MHGTGQQAQDLNVLVVQCPREGVRIDCRASVKERPGQAHIDGVRADLKTIGDRHAPFEKPPDDGGGPVQQRHVDRGQSVADLLGRIASQGHEPREQCDVVAGRRPIQGQTPKPALSDERSCSRAPRQSSTVRRTSWRSFAAAAWVYESLLSANSSMTSRIRAPVSSSASQGSCSSISWPNRAGRSSATGPARSPVCSSQPGGKPLAAPAR
ncbi:hypothetical protein ACGFJ5_23615 [Micromonospora echinaurantiaca]|uniref:hypothetical protein n=1 Tax=Micromonospora echinaurantiaca TaxID=47857 RepID=UPI00371BD22C